MNKLLIILTITTILSASDADTFNNEVFARPRYSFSGDHGIFPSSFKLKGNHVLFSTQSKETVGIDKSPEQSTDDAKPSQPNQKSM